MIMNGVSNTSSGGGGGEFSWWRKSQISPLFRYILWSVGHIFGIYTIEEYIYLGKILLNDRGLQHIWHQIKKRKIGNLRGLSIENFAQIGEGLILPHGMNIAISNGATIGSHCTICQGVTIGSIVEGTRKGEPIIEDNVFIGPNAVIVGGIIIGHNAIIAGNSFVNFDVPENSIVIGNPGVIHKKGS